MPSATATIVEKSSSKRKTAPIKNNSSKENKKAKTTSELETKSKSKTKSTPPKKIKDNVKENSHEPTLRRANHNNEASKALSEDDENFDEESLPKAEDGLHPDRVKAVAQNNQSSREAHAKQKQLALERKAAKPLADDLARTKKIWERLRRKSHVPLDERKQLVTELFAIITGKVKDFVLKHDSVRVVQTAIKYANQEQKRTIAKELAGTYRQLAESRYAKFLIGKLLVQGDDTIRDVIVPEFFGHVRHLIKHSEASWILDDIYRGIATKQQKASLLREWYGAEFVLFRNISDQTTDELSKILEADPGKRSPIMRSLTEMINQLIQKKMTGFTLLHDAMLQYYLNIKSGTTEATEFIEMITGDEGDLCKNLAFTKSGSRLMALILAHTTAKDRRRILKAYKETFQAMATDQHGHIVILAAYEVIDDTVLTAKSIFPELLSKDTDKQVENIVSFVNDLNARTTILYLYQGRSKALFPNSHSSDLDILTEIDVARSSTSKKDPIIRRAELAKSLSPYVLKAIENAASDLVQTSFGCQFITEVLFGADGDKSAALESVAYTAVGDPSSLYSDAGDDMETNATNSETIGHIGTRSHGAKMLRSLIAGGRFDPGRKAINPIVPALNFPDILYPHIKNHIVEWATGPASFVILALIESNNFSHKEKVMALLRSATEKLQKASSDETLGQKASRSAAEEGSTKNKNSVTGKNEKKSLSSKKQVQTGNKGSQLILGLL
ncbi:RNA-binding protein [Blumeria hordei DH14]|uniref:RNA-binding protein n=1 Tax=Blumeria graminis f. sp. hordei (strain DH14) TaxID=546991 RepID=N1J9Z1_BLUG1|nr:RNA-binding protein [Blumeria hordei DH14]